MKICYVSNSVIPSKTANSIHVMKMCQAMAQAGNEVTLLALSREPAEQVGNDEVYSRYSVDRCFEIVFLPSPNIRGTQYIYTAALFFHLLRKKYDLVYGRFVLGCYLAALLGKQTIFEAHRPISSMNRVDAFFLRKLFNKKTFLKLVVISESLKKWFQEKSSIKGVDIQVAHDGADLPQHDETVLLKGRSTALAVGYVGHLYQGKGMEVVEKIAPHLPDVDFYIVGGMEEDILFWRKRITQKNVIFYGYVPQRETGKYIRAFDVCLLPNQKVVLPHGANLEKDSIGEFTSPLKLFEYMAYAKAIVASDLPVLREVLNEKNAFLADPDDPEAWVQAIRRLQKDEMLRENLGQKAWKDVREYYTWTQRAKSVLK